MIKGYKVFDSNFCCRGYQYEIGKTYTHVGKIEPCESGFHFCEKLVDCYEYYSFDKNNKIAEIIAHGETKKEGNKSVTSIIEIVKEITWDECLKIVNNGIDNNGRGNTGNWNTGDRNTGNLNTGDLNTGNLNTGNLNTGNWNTGDRNTGNLNTGNLNTGNRNTGDRNTGNRNTGDRNTGDLNTGDWNTGNRNTGDWNTGNRNTGDRNTGDWNTGDRNTGNLNTGNLNTGDRNTGDRNTGDLNTGNRNTGDRNTGDRNTGDLNKTDFSSGVLCTKEPKILIFDKKSDMTISEWRNSKFAELFYSFTTCEWISEIDMTDQEKIDHPKFYVQSGYLKTYTPEEAWQNWYKSKSSEEIELVKQIPNFSYNKFQFITGIDLRGVK